MRNGTGVSAAGVRVTLRTSDSCSFARFLLLRLFLCALVPAQNAVYLVRSLSPSVPICVTLCLFCPPALRSCLMTYMFFSAVRLATVFALHRAFGFRLTAPVTCHSHGPTCSLLANQSWSSRKSLQLTSLPQTHLLLSQTSPLYSLECSKYEIVWQSHVFHCFTAIHYSLSASPPVIAVIKWKPRRLWRLECGEERRGIILGRLSGCGVPSGGHGEHAVMQIRALPFHDKCP